MKYEFSVSATSATFFIVIIIFAQRIRAYLLFTDTSELIRFFFLVVPLILVVGSVR